MAESKGYSGGFVWEFWLGVIGLLVVGLRPNKQSAESTYTPMYGGALQTSSESKAKWTCVCGAKNNSTRKICVLCDKPLGATQKIVPVDSSNDIVNTEVVEKKQAVQLLEQLAKLHEQGILTDEEFQQKKTDILAKM